MWLTPSHDVPTAHHHRTPRSRRACHRRSCRRRTGTRGRSRHLDGDRTTRSGPIDARREDRVDAPDQPHHRVPMVGIDSGEEEGHQGEQG